MTAARHARPPSQRGLVLRVAAATMLVVWATAVGIALLVPLSLGANFTASARFTALLFAGGGTLLSVLLALDTLRRVRPIHQYFARLTRSLDIAPPSDAAVRDAYAAPMRLALTFVFCASTVAVVDAIIAASTSGWIDALPRARLDLAASMVVVLSASPLRLGVEWALGEWLARIDPAEISALVPHAFSPRSLADRFAFRAAIPAAAATMLAAVGAGAHLHSLSPFFAALLLTPGIGAAAYWLAWRTASTTADEVHNLAVYAHSLGPDEPDLQPPPPPPGTLSAELHGALVALSDRLALVRENEAHAQRAMTEAQHLKTQFLASMSHDLRSPLNSILGFSEVLLNGLDGPLLDAQTESVRAIQHAGEDLLRLLTDVLDSARLDAGRLELRRAWTPSVEILTEAVRRGRLIAAERTHVNGRALAIEAELQPGLPPVYVDSARIVQAVVGLFGHAARAMEGGSIRLRAYVAQAGAEAEAQVRVDITDTGGGIPESERERIFEAFRGARGGRRIAGLGLGLSLARALVREHGGDVAVNSVGDGITFTVSLPTDGPMPAGSPPRERPRSVRPQ